MNDDQNTLPGTIIALGISDIDPEEGILACGSEEIYENVVTDFVTGAEGKMQELSDYLKQDERENFIIKVHALKSTARFLGAAGFSRMAKLLEEEGPSLGKEELNQRADALLERYSFLSSALRKALPGEEDAKKPLISEQALGNALCAISELAEDFNFDEIDFIMERLEKYALPEHFQETYCRLKSYVTDVARDDIITAIQAFMG